MNKGNRLQQLEDACRDIIKINMWYELPDYVFFSISDTIDGTSDEFAINVYKNIDKSLLEYYCIHLFYCQLLSPYKVIL